MGACKSCNTREEPATFTLGDAPEREPRMSQGRQSGASAQRSAVPGNEIPGRNSFLIGAVMTNPAAGSARGSGVAGQQREQMPSMPPCGSPLQPCGSPMQPCGGELQPCGSVDCQQDQWSGIPVEDRQILQPNYDIGPNPVLVEQTEAEMQPRTSAAPSHKSMNSYGVVPQASAPVANGGGFTHTFNEDAILPNDWNSLQQMAAEGKIVIHDESENVQVTHEEISPGVLREVNRGRAGSKYSYYNEATGEMAQPQPQLANQGSNNLQINMMHEVQHSNRGSRNSNRGSHNHFAQKEAMHASAMTQEVILEEDTESKRLEPDMGPRGVEVELESERRTSRNSNREVFSDGEEDEQAPREGEEENAREEQTAEEAQDRQHDGNIEEEEPRSSRRSGRRTSSKKRSSKRRRRRRTSSKKKSGSQKKRWFK